MSAARRLKGAVWSASVVRRAAPTTGTADMPRYAQLVMGPAGSGKVRIWSEKRKVGELVGGREGILGSSRDILIPTEGPMRALGTLGLLAWLLQSGL